MLEINSIELWESNKTVISNLKYIGFIWISELMEEIMKDFQMELINAIYRLNSQQRCCIQWHIYNKAAHRKNVQAHRI